MSHKNMNLKIISLPNMFVKIFFYKYLKFTKIHVENDSVNKFLILIV